MTRVIDTYGLWPMQAGMLFHVLLPLRNLFQRPQLSDLAQVIEGLWLGESKAPTYGAGMREEIEL